MQPSGGTVGAGEAVGSAKEGRERERERERNREREREREREKREREREREREESSKFAKEAQMFNIPVNTLGKKKLRIATAVSSS